MKSRSKELSVDSCHRKLRHRAMLSGHVSPSAERKKLLYVKRNQAAAARESATGFRLPGSMRLLQHMPRLRDLRLRSSFERLLGRLQVRHPPIPPKVTRPARTGP